MSYFRLFERKLRCDHRQVSRYLAVNDMLTLNATTELFRPLALKLKSTKGRKKKSELINLAHFFFFGLVTDVMLDHLRLATSQLSRTKFKDL